MTRGPEDTGSEDDEACEVSPELLGNLGRLADLLAARTIAEADLGVGDDDVRQSGMPLPGDPDY